MPGQWLTTQNKDSDSGVFTAQKGSQTKTVNLPNEHFIGAIECLIEDNFSGGTSPSQEIDLERVRLLVGGGAAAFIDVPGDTLHAIVKYETSVRPTADDGGTATSPAREHVFVPMGRVRRDRDVMFPAKAFPSVQLQFTVSIDDSSGDQSGSVDSIDLSITVEQWVSTDPVSSKQVRRIVQIKDESAGADETVSEEITKGNVLRAIYIATGARDNLRGDNIKVQVGEGAEIPFAMKERQLHEMMRLTYGFHDGSVPQAGTGQGDTVYKVDFDILEDLQQAIDTADTAKVEIIVKAASSGTSGNTRYITEEVVSIAES